MAITTKAETLGRHVFITSKGGLPFAVNATSADITAGEIVKTAPSTGNIYLQKADLQVVGSCGWFAERLTGSATAAATTLLGPIYFDAGVPDVHPFKFNSPIKVTASKDLIIDSTAAASAFCYIEGFTA